MRGIHPGRGAVERGKHVHARIAAIDQVQAVELRRADNRVDLILERVDVVLDLAAIDVRFLRGDDLALHVGEQVGDRLRGLTGHRDGRFAKRKAVGDAREALHIRFHHFRDGPDRRVILGRGDGFAGRDFGLGLGQTRVDALERLQRHHRAGVRQNARHVMSFQKRRFAPGYACRFQTALVAF